MKLTGPEAEAARQYSGSAYSTINLALRFGEQIDAKTRATIKHLDSAIAKSEATRKLIVYRGVGEDFAAALERRGLRRGDSIIDAGFVSASTREDIARQFLGSEGGGMLLKIHVPTGSKILEMQPIFRTSGGA